MCSMRLQTPHGVSVLVVSRNIAHIHIFSCISRKKLELRVDLIIQSRCHMTSFKVKTGIQAKGRGKALSAVLL